MDEVDALFDNDGEFYFFVYVMPTAAPFLFLFFNPKFFFDSFLLYQ